MLIRTRMLVLVALPVAGMLAASLYAAHRAHEALRDARVSAALTASQRLSREIDRVIERSVKEWKGVTGSETIRAALAQANELGTAFDELMARDDRWKGGEPDPALLESLLESPAANDLRAVVTSHPLPNGERLYAEVIITGVQGENIAQTELTTDYIQSDEAWWNAAMARGLSISEPGYDNSAGVYSVDVGIRIDSPGGEPLGVVKVVINIGIVIDLVAAEFVALKESGATDMLVLTKGGLTIHSVANPQAPLFDDAHMLDDAFVSMLDEPVWSTTRADDQEAEVFASISPFEKGSLTGWRTLILWDPDRLFESTRNLGAQILLLGCAVAVVTSLVALRFSRSMTSRIGDLAAQAKGYRTNGRCTFVPDSSGDELGQLSRDLREMASSLERGEKRLRDERLLLETIISTIPYQVYWRDEDLVISGCNRSFAEWVDPDDPDAILRWPSEAESRATDDLMALFAGDRAVFESGRPVLDENREIARPDGGRAVISLSQLPIIDRDGNRIGVLGGFVDNTERLQLEGQLAQAQKLESIGQLASGIAHEINTPAQYVRDNTVFLKREFVRIMSIIDLYASQLDPDAPSVEWERRCELAEEALQDADFEFLRDEIPSAIDQSLEGIERIAHIVRAMKDFSHPGATEKTMCDLNQAIDTTVTVCKSRWKYAADLELDLDPDLPKIPCLLDEFNQVVLNLVVNAADAIEEMNAGTDRKGLISIRTGSDLERVAIEVRDNGPGIPSEKIDKVFDPFFTTKPVGKGTGQGLAICRDLVVEKMGGSIECTSTQGEGTCFRVALPIRDHQELRRAA